MRRDGRVRASRRFRKSREPREIPIEPCRNDGSVVTDSVAVLEHEGNEATWSRRIVECWTCSSGGSRTAKSPPLRSARSAAATPSPEAAASAGFSSTAHGWPDEHASRAPSPERAQVQPSVPGEVEVPAVVELAAQNSIVALGQQGRANSRGGKRLTPVVTW
jgi:hypothetical protein